MNKKDECETAIRSLCQDWARELGFIPSSDYHARFSSFVTWLNQKGSSQYLNFRSSMGPLYDAELWFDQEMKQTWRH